MLRIILSFLLVCSLSGQVVYVPMVTDTTAVDTVSVEELFLKKISDEALAKDEKRKKIYRKVAMTVVVYVAVKAVVRELK